LLQASNDMKNLLDSTEIATVFLDNHLNVKRYTPQATTIFNLIPSDVGRSIEHLVPKLKYTTLARDVREVLRTVVSMDTQVETTDNRWYIMRVMTYRTIDNVTDGVVITFTDITTLKRLETSLRECEARLL